MMAKKAAPKGKASGNMMKPKDMMHKMPNGMMMPDKEMKAMMGMDKGKMPKKDRKGGK